MTRDQHYCKNCEHPLEEGQNFCPECGQKTDDQLTMKVLFSNTISNYFSVDARFFVSFIPLLFKPGYLPAKFIEGKRLRYLHPAQFYLFISVVFFFLLSFEARRQQEFFEKSVKNTFDKVDAFDTTDQKVLDSLNTNLDQKLKESGVFEKVKKDTSLDLDSLIKSSSSKKNNINFGLNRKTLDSLSAAGASHEEMLKAIGYKEGQPEWKKRIYKQALKFYEKRGGGLLEAFYDTIPIAMFFLLPIYALLLKIFFFRKGRYSYHLVFSFYFFSFLFTVFSIMLIANFIFAVPVWINWLLILGTAIYLIAGIRRFYQVKFITAFFKSIVVSFFYFMFIIPTSAIIIAIVTFLIY